MVLIVGCCIFGACYIKRRKKGQTDRKLSEYSFTADEQLELIRWIKEWGKLSSRKLGSFIPSGVRHYANYMGTASDANVTPYRGGGGMYREQYPSYQNV